MNTKFTFLIALCLLAISNTWATKHLVATTAEFTTAWGAYVAGDTIVMAAGTYSAFGDKTITKSVTIMAADTTANATKPVIEAGQFIYGLAAASFVMNGIEAYYFTEAATVVDSKYFLQVVVANISTVTIPLISLRNCKIHGYSRGLIRVDSSTAANIPNITTLFVNNCLIYDISRIRADYSIFACKSGKFTNVFIKNSTFYNSPGGVWYNENTDRPVVFLMENCCILKTTNATTTGVQTNASKLVIYNNGNVGSTRTIRNTIISDSFDGSSTNMQIKFGSNGTDNFGVIDNVVFGNNMNATIFNSSILTTDIKTQTTTFGFNYSALTITTDPNTISNLGDPRWKLNGITTGIKPVETLNANVYAKNAYIYFENLPNLAKIEVYSTNGRQLIVANANSQTLILPIAEKMSIVRISANGKTQTCKVGF